MAKVDETSKAIIRLLQDGRRSFSAIAEELGITENTVRSRVNRLIEDRVLTIKGLVNPQNMPSLQVAIMGIKVTTMDLERKARELSSLHGVISCAVVTGRYDLILQLELSEDEDCRDLQGLSLKNVTLSLVDNQTGKTLFSELGEMLFTHYGMSGPLVLSASSHLKTIEPGRYSVVIDLKPGLDEKQLDARILRDFAEFSNRDFINSLSKLLPKKMIPVIVYRCRIPAFLKVNSITKEQRHTLVSQIKRFVVPVDGFRPVEEAIITSGGVNCAEVNPRTMESKRVKGLYFAGEVLDVDGYTGGFNLQIAFCTGYAAGLFC